MARFSIDKPKVESASDFSKSGKYIVIVPDKQNLSAADLFVTQNCHPVKQVELVKIIIINMPVYQNAKIRLYFVVPDDVYNTFERQDYTTQDNTSKEDRPVKRTNSILDSVEQWAMKVLY